MYNVVCLFWKVSILSKEKNHLHVMITVVVFHLQDTTLLGLY